MARRAQFKLGAIRGSGTLGTFTGVFTPSVLTILGIILFRRLGFVTGSAGLGGALLIIVLANGISLLTSLSLAAIATNFRVGSGGDYYLISRTLGLGFGGAIGLVLWLAQSVSIAFYCIGFGEVLSGLFGMGGDMAPRLIAAAAMAFLFIFAWLGADWASRFQYVVMVVLGAALVSFVAGGLSSWDPSRISLNWGAPADAPDFWLLFAIFFPAVTGFTQGVSMSGDLRDPGKSIPAGTFWAVGISFGVYLGAAFLFAGGLPGDVLLGFDAMESISAWRWLISAGVIAATLSSAMASFLGAPRILQALSQDRIFRFLNPFAAGFGPLNNPRRGVLLSAGIAAVAIALGNLNVIAPIVAMFFLISYGLLNYATFFEARAASPAFRPRFRFFSAKLSLIGALACLAIMLMINAIAGILSVILLFGIYQYLKRTASPARWADGSRAHLFRRIREHLFAMGDAEAHSRDWRPQILALSKDPQRRAHLLRFANWIEGGTGLTTAVEMIVDTPGEPSRNRQECEQELRASIHEQGLQAFALAVKASDLRSGFDVLVQAYGIGPLKANIVLLNWLEQRLESSERDEEAYGPYLREAIRLGRNMVLFDADDDEWRLLMAQPAKERRIDVWMWEEDECSQLMLMLAHLMKRSPEWEGCRLRAIAPGKKKHLDRAEARLRGMLDAVRIEAEPIAIEVTGLDTICETSRDASLVFLPMRLRGERPVGPLGNSLAQTLDELPAVALAIAAEDLRLSSGPDEGQAADLAALRDDAEGAAAELKEARAAVLAAGEAVRAAAAESDGLEHAEAGDDARVAAAARLAELETEAMKAGRRLDRARAKAKLSDRTLVEGGGETLAAGEPESVPDEELGE